MVSEFEPAAQTTGDSDARAPRLPFLSQFIDPDRVADSYRDDNWQSSYWHANDWQGTTWQSQSWDNHGWWNSSTTQMPAWNDDYRQGSYVHRNDDAASEEHVMGINSSGVFEALIQVGKTSTLAIVRYPRGTVTWMVRLDKVFEFDASLLVLEAPRARSDRSDYDDSRSSSHGSGHEWWGNRYRDCITPLCEYFKFGLALW